MRGCYGEGPAETQATVYCGRWALSIELDGLEGEGLAFHPT